MPVLITGLDEVPNADDAFLAVEDLSEAREISENRKARMQKNALVPPKTMRLEDLALDGHRYAAITLTDVLEHIPEPTRLLSALAELVEPGGVVAVKVPNGTAQWAKERWLARLTVHRISLADGLVVRRGRDVENPLLSEFRRLQCIANPERRRGGLRACRRR